MILALDAEEVSLESAGGKGASLGRLRREGFAVPPGFILTTEAYRQFVTINGLDAWILSTAQHVAADDPSGLEDASRAIRARFAEAVMPQALVDQIQIASRGLGEPAVAVRSSATTEDLPEASFAGQHDTFLNVVDGQALIQAVQRCWSSLWTARAIGYRARNQVPHSDAALAVIVQEMVQSEASGVLFTANPLTGKRTETVVDATLGLGEALVSGQVEPDHYVVNPAAGRIVDKFLGTKDLVMRGNAAGGVAADRKDSAGQQALPDAAILELALVGERAARLFGAPQDMEWAWANRRLFVLQSRPITSLFPLPEGVAAEPLEVFVSFGAFQGMLDPLTPLGRDFFCHGATRVRRLLGLPGAREPQRVFAVAGQRLFFNITGAARHPRARALMKRALTMIEPGTGQALEVVLAEPAFAPQRTGIRHRILARIAPFAARIVGNVVFNVLRPDAGRVRIQRRIETVVRSFETESAAAASLSQRVALFDAAIEHVGQFAPVVGPGLMTGLGSLRLLHYLAAGVPDAAQQVLETTRGLPHNVTTEMDLALWRAAVLIRADSAAQAHFRRTDVSVLAAEALSGRLPDVAREALGDFLRQYGMRGVAEIDIGRARWREDPAVLIQALKSYLDIADASRAPEAVFAKGAASAHAAMAGLIGGIRRTRLGWLKAPVARWAARCVRALAGLRESPKFTAVRLLGILRESLLAGGRELAVAGVLIRPDDIFFLQLSELRDMAAGGLRDCGPIIAERRNAFDREKRRRQVPRVLLSDGRAFFDGVGRRADDDSVIVGSPVSPGTVEGIVRVVLDPRGVQLAPGEIMVCPGTDPAWTPLFLAAGGLVMEVGGLMTHGSVVAREYGIPAVVGVHQATLRLKTGQRVRVDGSRGTIALVIQA